MSVVDSAIYVDGHRKLAPPSLEGAFVALRSCRDEGRSFAWIGMLRPGPDEIDAVGRKFSLHELAVEDTVSAHQRPKLERYGDTMFVVLRPARYIERDEAVELGEVHVFLGPEFAITVRHAEEPDLSQVRKCLEEDPELLAHGPFVVLWGVLDRVVDDYAQVVEGLQADVDERSRCRSSAEIRPSPSASISSAGK
jgi:magnesium transporter